MKESTTYFSPPTLFQRALYWIGKKFFLVAFKLFWRLEIIGQENVPKEGGVIIAANHLSYADPPLAGACCSRNLFYFAKVELFKNPIFGWLIHQVNAFPVKRYEHDITAFKTAQRVLENGHALLLFPEGRRSKTGELGKAKPGVGMLAKRVHVPVVPVCILNSNRMKEFRKLKVAFGKPLFPGPSQDKSDYQTFSDAVLEAIANLKLKM